MSGMMGADALSADSGPNSEFRFQDIEKKDRGASPSVNIEDGDVGVSDPTKVKKKLKIGGQQHRGTQGGQSNLGGGIPRAPILHNPKKAVNLTESEGPDDQKSDAIKPKAKIKLSRLQTHSIVKHEPNDLETIEEAKEPSATQIQNAIKLKLQEKVKQDYNDKLKQLQQNQTIYQEQISTLTQEKTKLNDQYQKQMHELLREKEELQM